MTDPSPVPRLDLAPKLNRPLRLWWPPDYLRLLYWAFFFPQAIRWYLKTFGLPRYTDSKGHEAIWKTLREDPIQKWLVVQALISVLLGVGGLTTVLQILSVSVDYKNVIIGLGVGLLIGTIWLGKDSELAVIITLGVVNGLTIAVLSAGGASSLGNPSVDFVTLSIAVFYWWVFNNSLLGSVMSGVAVGTIISILQAITLGIVFAVVLGLKFGVVIGEVIALIVGVGISVSALRMPDWLLASCLVWLSKGKSWGSRVTLIPLPDIRQRLQIWLELDWVTGVHNIGQVLSYTMQFIPALGAVKTVLNRSPNDQVLFRVSALTSNPHDWNLLYFCVFKLTDWLPRQVVEEFLLPIAWKEWWRSHAPFGLPQNIRVAAACAGFWFWHTGDAAGAEGAFSTVRNLYHGPELHSIAHAIAESQKASELPDIVAFFQIAAWLDILPDPELRSGALAALRTLRVVAADACTANNASALLNRSTALNRANAALTRLIETGGETCPEPEWPLIKEIALKWRDIISKAGGVVGEEVLRQPVANPYEGYSGLPVTGPSFIGRGDTLAKIETRWAAGDRLPPLILYGHRRMGKTSILRNLARSAPTGTLLVYLNMQDAGWVDHTGELLRDFADAIHRAAGTAGLDAGSIPVAMDFGSLGAGRQGLNALLDRLDGQMAGRRLILAVDEFEVIQEGIEKGRIDPDLLHYLRAKTSQYGWLALIFAGLHTLDEMGHDYRSAFYGAAEHIRVGYLAHDDAIRLITQPHPDFALEYEPELREELYRLTYGQPYLLQRICWELVNRWNERFLKEGETTPRILVMDELAPVLTPDFYAAAGYYFDGVWDNVTEAERQMMRAMAGRDAGGWTAAELAAATGQSEETVSASLDLLRRHDVILDEMGGVRFAAELLRRWVARYQAADASVG